MELREIREGYTEIVRDKPFQWEEDGLKVTRTCAWSGPSCHEGCGVLFYTDQDDNLAKVEGDPEHPFNQGRLCMTMPLAPGISSRTNEIDSAEKLL